MQDRLVEFLLGSSFLGANLKRNVLPNGLDPVGDELVDDVPWVVSPLGYTVRVYVCAHTWIPCEIIYDLCFVKLYGAHFKFPFIDMYRRVHHHFLLAEVACKHKSIYRYTLPYKAIKHPTPLER